MQMQSVALNLEVCFDNGKERRLRMAWKLFAVVKTLKFVADKSVKYRSYEQKSVKISKFVSKKLAIYRSLYTISLLFIEV